MVLTCCAYGCNSRFIKGSGITFHTFPKDPHRRRLWEIQVKRKNFKATDSSKLCSKHFTEDCFNKEKFGGTWLKDNAIPTIFNFPQYMIRIQNEFPKERKDAEEGKSSDFLHTESVNKVDKNDTKRLYYSGDFNEDDMESPEKAKMFFSITQHQMSDLKKKVKALNNSHKRLKKKITFLKEARKKNHSAAYRKLSSLSMNQTGHSSVLEFLMLVGKLKHLKRTGWVKRNIPECESVAGHMYRMSIMAFLLDDDAFVGINKDRCIKMALIHDIAECIVGDLTPFCGVSKEEKHKREEDAMKKLCSLVGKEHGEEIFSLFMEYEEQLTPEAKAVKDLDKFDMILQAFEYEVEMKQPNFLQGFFDNTEGTFVSPLVSQWVQELKSRREKSQAEIAHHVESV